MRLPHTHTRSISRIWACLFVSESVCVLYRLDARIGETLCIRCVQIVSQNIFETLCFFVSSRFFVSFLYSPLMSIEHRIAAEPSFNDFSGEKRLWKKWKTKCQTSFTVSHRHQIITKNPLRLSKWITHTHNWMRLRVKEEEAEVANLVEFNKILSSDWRFPLNYRLYKKIKTKTKEEKKDSNKQINSNWIDGMRAKVDAADRKQSDKNEDWHLVTIEIMIAITVAAATLPLLPLLLYIVWNYVEFMWIVES